MPDKPSGRSTEDIAVEIVNHLMLGPALTIQEEYDFVRGYLDEARRDGELKAVRECAAIADAGASFVARRIAGAIRVRYPEVK